MSASCRVAVATAGRAVGVAVSLDDEPVACGWVATRAATSEFVLDLVADAVRRVGLTPADVDEWAACRGPGSFTGIRVGLATIRGLSLATGGRTRTVTAFEQDLAAVGGVAEPVVVVRDARRGQVYAQGFASGSFGTPPTPWGDGVVIDPTAEALAALVPADVDVRAVVGTGIAEVRRPIDEAFPTARVLEPSMADADAILTAVATGWGGADHDPLYIRPPDATLPSSS